MNLGNADIVFCYLFPDIMPRLGRKLKAELRPRSRVISCNFPIPEWIPEKVLTPRGKGRGDPIFIYSLPFSLRDAAVSRPNA